MVASTGASTEVLFKPSTQRGFGSRTDGVRTDTDDPPHGRIGSTEFVLLHEEIDTAFRQQGAPRKFAQRSSLARRITETGQE